MLEHSIFFLAISFAAICPLMICPGSTMSNVVSVMYVSAVLMVINNVTEIMQNFG